jgi:hypothetical protein
MDVDAVTEGGLAAAVGGADVIYNLGADEVDIAPGAKVIYQGSHGDRGAHRADIILPAAAYPEEAGLFVNTEGRPQLAFRASFPPGEARENWAILRALSAEVGATQPWNTIGQLRVALTEAVPHLGAIDEVPVNEMQALPGHAWAGGFRTRDLGPLPGEPDRAGQHADGRAECRGQGAGGGPDGGGVSGLDDGQGGDPGSSGRGLWPACRLPARDGARTSTRPPAS